MKIACSCCQKELTQDLYYVKAKYDSFGYLKKTSNIFEDRKDYFQDKSIKKGLFFITKEVPEHSWTDKDIYGEFEEYYTGSHIVIKKKTPKITVSKDSFLDGIIPTDAKNCCCNWSHEPLVCKCGQVLGVMLLDCYQDGGVELESKSVLRQY